MFVVERGAVGVAVWGSCGVSVLLLVEEVDDLQLITQANSKAKARAAWGRDCVFIVISLDLADDLRNESEAFTSVRPFPVAFLLRASPFLQPVCPEPAERRCLVIQPNFDIVAYLDQAGARTAGCPSSGWS